MADRWKQGYKRESDKHRTLEMADTAQSHQKVYDLDLDNQKKNVFVTQLHERYDIQLHAR